MLLYKMWVPQDMFFLSISFPRIKRNEKKLDKTKNPNLMERYKKRKIKNKTLSHEFQAKYLQRYLYTYELDGRLNRVE